MTSNSKSKKNSNTKVVPIPQPLTFAELIALPRDMSTDSAKLFKSDLGTAALQKWDETRQKARKEIPSKNVPLPHEVHPAVVANMINALHLDVVLPIMFRDGSIHTAARVLRVKPWKTKTVHKMTAKKSMIFPHRLSERLAWWLLTHAEFNTVTNVASVVTAFMNVDKKMLQKDKSWILWKEAIATFDRILAWNFEHQKEDRRDLAEAFDAIIMRVQESQDALWDGSGDTDGDSESETQSPKAKEKEEREVAKNKNIAFSFTNFDDSLNNEPKDKDLFDNMTVDYNRKIRLLKEEFNTPTKRTLLKGLLKIDKSLEEIWKILGGCQNKDVFESAYEKKKKEKSQFELMKNASANPKEEKELEGRALAKYYNTSNSNSNNSKENVDPNWKDKLLMRAFVILSRALERSLEIYRCCAVCCCGSSLESRQTN